MSLTITPRRIVEESDSPLLLADRTWERVELGSVAKILNGDAFPSKSFSKERGVPLIRIRDITGTDTSTRFDGEFDKKYLIANGDLLVGMDGEFKCARWSGSEALLNQRVCKIVPDSKHLDLDFLTYLLPGYLDAIHAVTSSTTVTHLSSRDIGEIPIPLPTLETQKALVERLTEYQSKQKGALSHLTTARRAVRHVRRAVLAAACSGRLTADWRGSSSISDSARELVDAINSGRSARKRRATPPSTDGEEVLPEGWAMIEVESLVDVGTGATPLRSRSDYYSGTVPWVTSGAVNQGLIRGADEFITDLALKETNAKVFPAGTLLVAMYGEGQTRGRVAELGIDAATNQAVAALQFDEHSAPIQPYLRLFFERNYEQIRLEAFGGVQPNLNLGLIRRTLVPLPPLQEQGEIIRRVNVLLARADALSGRLEKAELSVSRSFTAVLSKAFRGELVKNRS